MTALKKVAFDERNEELLAKAKELISDDSEGDSLVLVDARLLELEGGLAQSLESNGYDVAENLLSIDTQPPE